MSEHMSAKAWRVSVGLDVPGVEQEKSTKKRQKSKYLIRSGVALFEHGKKVKEVNSEWTPIKKERKHEEDDLTKQVAEYCELLQAMGKVQVFSHIPQETFTKNWGIKMKNKRMGVRSGVPDMLIVFKNDLLFLELKKEKGGVVSLAQKIWIDAIRSSGGNARVARGWKQAKQIIDSCIT